MLVEVVQGNREEQKTAAIWGSVTKKKTRESRANSADEMKDAIKASWTFITSQQNHRLQQNPEPELSVYGT